MSTTAYLRSHALIRGWLPILFGAAAMLASASCSASGGGVDDRAAGRGGQGGDAASCVAPVLGTTPDPQPLGPGTWPSLGAVAQGSAVTVYGRWYFAGPCQDIVTQGAAVPSALPEGAVVLSLRGSDGSTVDLATVHPGDTAEFSATLELPADSATGPATITDNRGHLINLEITDA